MIEIEKEGKEEKETEKRKKEEEEGETTSRGTFKCIGINIPSANGNTGTPRRLRISANTAPPK